MTIARQQNNGILRPLPANPRATTTLVCLPPAGGSAYGYRTWAAQLPSRFELVAAHLPGREGRFREPPHKTIAAVVEEVIEGLQALPPRPLVLFGHSMGAVVAYETAVQLRRRGLPGPERLMVCGMRAPHLPSRRKPRAGLSDGELVEVLRGYGGTPREVIDNEELLELYLPIIRADFAAYEAYQPSLEEPLGCPIQAFAGDDDDGCTPEELEGWARHGSAFQSKLLPGGHFFLRDEALWLPVLRDFLG